MDTKELAPLIQKTSIYGSRFEASRAKKTYKLCNKYGLELSLNVALSCIVSRDAARVLIYSTKQEWRYLGMSVDYVIYDFDTGQIVLAIEYQGWHHGKYNVQELDALKKRLLKIVNIELIEIWPDTLQKKFPERFKSKKSEKTVFHEIEEKLKAYRNEQ